MRSVPSSLNTTFPLLPAAGVIPSTVATQLHSLSTMPLVKFKVSEWGLPCSSYTCVFVLNSKGGWSPYMPDPIPESSREKLISKPTIRSCVFTSGQNKLTRLRVDADIYAPVYVADGGKVGLPVTNPFFIGETAVKALSV